MLRIQKSLEQAIQLFDAAEYWECHEVLEAVWLESEGIERRFLAGMILLAAALHKAHRMDSPRGGRRNYAKALTHLALVPDSYEGIDIRELESRVHQALRDAGYHPNVPRHSEIVSGHNG